MTAEPVVYVSRDPEIVAAVAQQRVDQTAWLAKVKNALATLPWAYGTARVSGMFGPLSVTAIIAEDTDAARAAGWKSGRHEGDVVPMRGTRGEAARAFLAQVGTCVALPSVIGAHGAPEYVSRGDGNGREIITSARVTVLDGAVWVEYPAEPTDRNVSRWASSHKGAPDGRWERARLSAYYAAKEAAEAAPDPAGAGQ